MAPSSCCSASILCGAVRYAGVAGSGASFRTFESVKAMTLDGSPNFVVLASGAGRDKALARYEAKAGTRLMPDSHNAAKQTGSTLESALDGFSASARRGLRNPCHLPDSN